MIMDTRGRQGAQPALRRSAFGELDSPSTFGDLARPSIFTELTPTTRVDPSTAARMRRPAPADAGESSSSPGDLRDAALDAAIQADLKAPTSRSRYGGSSDASQFGGLGDLDQSRFGAFEPPRR
jgi:hypothetical protein